MIERKKEILSLALVGLVMAGLMYGRESKRNKYPETLKTNKTDVMPEEYTVLDTWYDIQTVMASINEETQKYYIPEGLEYFHLFDNKCYRVSHVTLYKYPAEEIIENGVKMRYAPYGGTLEGNVVICQLGEPLDYEEAKEVLLEQGYLNIENTKRLEK